MTSARNIYFFNDTATTEIYTLSLHDALPISIFWDNGKVRDDLSRVAEYGRLLASLGINATTINNVNADVKIVTPEFTPQIARIADTLRPWGVQVAISVPFASPQRAGGLASSDPLDPKVAEFWKTTFNNIYK